MRRVVRSQPHAIASPSKILNEIKAFPKPFGSLKYLDSSIDYGPPESAQISIPLNKWDGKTIDGCRVFKPLVKATLVDQ